MTFKDLSLPVKVLFSAYLLTIGTGYLIAVLYVFLIDVEPHRKMGMDVLQGTIHKYYGRRGDTRIEGVLRGSMGVYLDAVEKKLISEWVESGASAEGFPGVKLIIDKNCVRCHNPASGRGIVPLTTYAEVKTVTNVDLGESIKGLARVSHVHLFGISLIFINSGFIFSLSSINRRLKLVIMVTPFLAILTDIGSWWFTKYKPVFAYTVIAGGALMGLALAAQITVPLYEMWFKEYRLPPREKHS